MRHGRARQPVHRPSPRHGLVLVLPRAIVGTVVAAVASASYLATPASASDTKARTALDATSSQAADCIDINAGLTPKEPLVPDDLLPQDEADPARWDSMGEAELEHELDDALGPVHSDEVTWLDDPSHATDSSTDASHLWPEGTAVWDIPMSDHPLVDSWIRYFQTRGKEHFRAWLSRITRFAPLFWPILERYGLPKDTIFLAMIESGFSPRATSWALAAGPWQFMPDTARRYGLEVGFWIDERRDFLRATETAAAYLRDLYEQFGDWELAWAAYNTGEGRIRRCVLRAKTKDFWQISKTRLLYKETKHYVPKLVAAARIAKDPAAFGIEPPEYLPPLSWETITVTTAMSLGTIGDACGNAVTVDELGTLNPALVRGVTPPGRDVVVRVPTGLGGKCALGISHMPPRGWLTYRLHWMKPKETLDAVAKTFHTNVDEILRFHRMTREQVARMDALVVPVPIEFAASIPLESDAYTSARRHAMALPGSAFRLVHRVRPGESLWSIAKRYALPVGRLMAVNGLGRRSLLRVGQRLRIPGS